MNWDYPDSLSHENNAHCNLITYQKLFYSLSRLKGCELIPDSTAFECRHVKCRLKSELLTVEGSHVCIVLL